MQGVKREVSGNFQLRVTNCELGVGVGSEVGAGAGRTGLGGKILRGEQLQKDQGDAGQIGMVFRLLQMSRPGLMEGFLSHWKTQATTILSPLP